MIWTLLTALILNFLNIPIKISRQLGTLPSFNLANQIDQHFFKGIPVSFCIFICYIFVLAAKYNC